MFERELDYYGITSSSGSISNPKSMAETIESFSQAKLKHDMFSLALECHYQFAQNKLENPGSGSVAIKIGKDHKLFQAGEINKEGKEELKNCLERYFGLVLESGSNPNRASYYFSVRSAQG